jgi:hypothetical protein
MFKQHLKDNVNEVILEINAIFAAYEWTFIIAGFVIALLILMFFPDKEYSIIPLAVAGFVSILKIARRMIPRI